jgi:chromosomal replication initiator protein
MCGESWDYGVFWKEACSQIREELSEQEWVMWFESIRYDHSTEKEIVVSVPSAFFRDQVKQRYLSLIEGKLRDISGLPLQIGFSIKKGNQLLVPRKAGKEHPLLSPLHRLFPRNRESRRGSKRKTACTRTSRRTMSSIPS